MKEKVKQRCYSSKIGPNTPEEARMIHKGVFDAADVWKPTTFARKLTDVTNEYDFEEFEEKEYHYYVGTFVAFYTLKYLGVVLAIKFAPEVLSFFE